MAHDSEPSHSAAQGGIVKSTKSFNGSFTFSSFVHFARLTYSTWSLGH